LTAKRDGQLFANHFSLDRAIGLHNIVAVTHEPRPAAMMETPFLLSHKMPFKNSACQVLNVMARTQLGRREPEESRLWRSASHPFTHVWPIESEILSGPQAGNRVVGSSSTTRLFVDPANANLKPPGQLFGR
jgi:hypothetical protein